MRTVSRTRYFAAVLAATALFFAVPVLGQTISYISKPAAVGSGLQSSLVRARLSTGAHGGITVRVESADTTLAFVTDAELTPGSDFVDIFVPNGSTDALFWIQALEDTTGMVTITASATGFSDGVDSVSVAVPAVELTGLAPTHNVLDPVDEFQVRVGLPFGSLISPLQKVRAGGPGLTANITNSASGVGELVTTSLTGQVVTVIIVPGQSTSPSTIAGGGVGFSSIGDGSTDVTVSIPGFIQQPNATRTVNVTPAALSYLSLPAIVGIGLQKGSLGIRTSGTQHGGTAIQLESSDSSKVLLSLDRYTEGVGLMNVFIPDGSIQVLFYAQVLDTATTGPVAVTATASGFATAVDTVHVISPFFTINSLQSSIDVLDPIDEFTLIVGRPNGAQTLILESQQARGGGPGITMTATSSDSAVGMLETLSERNDSVSVVIPPGEFISESTIGAGGVGFDGVGVGATQVTAHAPGFFPITNGIVNVAVTQPGVTWINLPPEGVGAGLQSISARVRLDAGSHGGVTVHIASWDSNLVLISPNDQVVGSGSIDIDLLDGSVDAFFYLQGIEDTTGTVTLYTETPGFTPDSTTVNLVMPYVRIGPGTLANSIDTLDPPDEFVVNTGVLSAGQFVNKEVRPGLDSVAVSVVADTSLAQLHSLSGPADSVTVGVQALSSSSPSTVQNGGVAFNGLSPGVATVSVSAPGFISHSSAVQSVTITAPTMAFSGLAGAEVGAGLRSNQVNVTLSTTGHGGVSVHVESGDSTVSLVAGTAAGPGLSSIDIPVANGSALARFYIHGIEDTTGTVQFTASAPGFVPTVDFINVVTPAVSILALESAIDVADGPDPFWAQVGVPNLAQTGLAAIQVRRPGTPPLVVSLETSNPLVSQLRQGVTTDDSVTVEIAPGDNTSPQTLVLGGAQHEPQAAGQTVITASIPGFIQVGTGQVMVDITNQNVSIAGVSGWLGAGLQTPVLTAQMGEGDHGGVTMHIEVDDSSKVLLSLNALAVGVGMLDVPLANGSTDVPFYVQAYDSSLGTVTVTASVTGFNPAMETIEIVPPGTEIILLADSIDVAHPDDEFIVRVGAINSDSTGIVEPQGVWAGSDTARVTVSSSDPLVGETVNLSSSGAAVIVNIPPAGVQTAGTVPTGGVAFHPVGAGSTVVKAEVPDFVTTDAGSTIVNVPGTATAITPRPTPAAFSLEQNIPNPFNPTTTIHFTLPARLQVKLSVFDVRGRRLTTLVDREMPAGLSSIKWDGRDLRGSQVSTGVYFYRIVAGSYVETRKMVMLK
jgi:hypothetical protein